MKKLFTVIAISAIAFMQQGFAQESKTVQTSPLLSNYYNLKDALVKSDLKMASASAVDLAANISTTDNAAVTEENRAVLLKDVNAISTGKNLKEQRLHFAALSANMVELAKKVKLSPDPVYQEYCPMQKASWLSNNKAIKNPYYGNAMLTCGNVKATL